MKVSDDLVARRARAWLAEHPGTLTLGHAVSLLSETGRRLQRDLDPDEIAIILGGAIERARGRT
jgi:hypothetical protein